MNHQVSEAIFQKAQTLIPGGVNSPARAFGAVGGSPVVIDHAEGPYLFDVDGNRYLDYVLSWGPMILGHRHPAVIQALEEAIGRGTSFGAPTRQENELAELVISLVPSIEKVRLVNSGTEATMSAIRLARGYTGRNKIVKFIGNYHGHVDSLLVAAGSAAVTLADRPQGSTAIPGSPGITPGTAADTLLVHYNDEEAVHAIFKEYGHEIAAAIVEPIAGNMGCVPGTMPFLAALRQDTKEYGSLLIFDEVLCGFRAAPGGAQERFGIRPDLTTLGKVIGGGLPVGAYGGRADIMDNILPVGKVFQAGTLSGNPLATAAGIATLRELQKGGRAFYDRIERTTLRLATGLQAAAETAGISTQVLTCGSLMTLFFTESKGPEIRSWREAATCRTDLFAKFFRGMLERGFYLPCSQFECLFLSSMHTDEMIDATIAAAAEVLQE